MDMCHRHNVTYQQTLRELLAMMDRKAKTDEARAHVLKAQSLIRIANDVSPYDVIRGSLPYFVKYNTQIGDRDESFFETECETQASDASMDPAMAGLMRAVKDMYVRSNKTDKDRAYDLILILRDTAIHYGMASATK